MSTEKKIKDDMFGPMQDDMGPMMMAMYSKASMAGSFVGIIPFGIKALDMITTHPLFDEMFEDDGDRKKLREALTVLSIAGDRIIEGQRDLVLQGAKVGNLVIVRSEDELRKLLEDRDSEDEFKIVD